MDDLQTVNIQIPAVVRYAIIDSACYGRKTIDKSSDLWASIIDALYVLDGGEITSKGDVMSSVSADGLDALQKVTQRTLDGDMSNMYEDEQKIWRRFNDLLKQKSATLNREILWFVESAYQHILRVRSSWVIQPSGSQIRIRGERTNMDLGAKLVCWVESANGRKMGVVADTTKPYGTQALCIDLNDISKIGDRVLRALENGTAIRHPWKMGLPHVDSGKPLVVAPFAYGELDNWFAQNT